MRQKRILLVTAISALVAAFIFIWMLDRSIAVESKWLEVVVSARAPSDDPCEYPQPNDRDLDEVEAVAAAECFVIINGYTDLPPSADKSKITPENVDAMTDELGMKMRHDSLERRAATVLRDAEFWGGSWIVTFPIKGSDSLHFDKNGKKIDFGRAVVMDLNGKNIRIQHSDYPMKMPGAETLSP